MVRLYLPASGAQTAAPARMLENARWLGDAAAPLDDIGAGLRDYHRLRRQWWPHKHRDLSAYCRGSPGDRHTNECNGDAATSQRLCGRRVLSQGKANRYRIKDPMKDAQQIDAGNAGIGKVPWFCGPSGNHVDFTPVQLCQRYGSHDTYVSRVKAIVNANVRDGVLLPEEAQKTVDEAKALNFSCSIKHLVDTFSNLADDKDVASQMPLFTEDAIVNTYFGDTLFASMRGREEIGNVFSGFIANFSALYHINGQMTVDIDGDRASSTHYCLVVLVSGEQGKEYKNFNGVIYKDEYVRQDGQWLIAKRVARFTWRDISELVAPN